MEKLKDVVSRLADRTQPPPSPAEMLRLLQERPYLSTIAMAWLRRTADEGMLYDPETRRKIAVVAVLATPVSGRYSYEIGDLTAGAETEADFYGPEDPPESPDTDAAIDTFLEQYSTADSDKESEVLEQIIFNPVADYAATLADEEEHSLPTAHEAEAGSDEQLINEFILKQKEPMTPRPVEVASEPLVAPPPLPTTRPAAKPRSTAEDTTLSESLAKIYIKQKNYTQAYEIINKLNLNNPQKNIYFAVQLRFLEKLMLNERLKAVATQQTTIN